MIIIGWLIILPFAILALPYMAIANTMKIEDNGYQTLMSFFSIPKFFFEMVS